MEAIEKIVNVRAGSDILKFAQCVILYSIAGGWIEYPSLAVAVFKSAPVICLAVGAAGRRGGAARCVAAGLALSAVADAALVWSSSTALLVGILFFAAAHIAYINAFGWQPLSLKTATVAYSFGVCYIVCLYKWSPPPSVLRLPVVVYGFLLATCAWRACARGGPAAIGAILFVISDAVLGYSLFGGQVPYKQIVVMSTYYAGQLGIALSVFHQHP